MQMAALSDLLPGDRAKVCGYQKGDKTYRHQLLAMGLTPNTQFEVIRRAPLGDPVEIKVRNFFLSLRQPEAVMLKLERVD